MNLRERSLKYLPHAGLNPKSSIQRRRLMRIWLVDSGFKPVLGIVQWLLYFIIFVPRPNFCFSARRFIYFIFLMRMCWYLSNSGFTNKVLLTGFLKPLEWSLKWKKNWSERMIIAQQMSWFEIHANLLKAYFDFLDGVITSHRFISDFGAIISVEWTL